MRNDNESLFERFERPLPPPGLRERTLREAGLALVRPPQREFWAILWESLWLRLVWTSAVAVLVTSHFVISTADDPALHGPLVPGLVVAEDYGNELSEIVDLPRIIALRPTLMGSQNAGAGLGGKELKGNLS